MKKKIPFIFVMMVIGFTFFCSPCFAQNPDPVKVKRMVDKVMAQLDPQMQKKVREAANSLLAIRSIRGYKTENYKSDIQKASENLFAEYNKIQDEKRKNPKFRGIKDFFSNMQEVMGLVIAVLWLEKPDDEDLMFAVPNNICGVGG